MTIAWPPIKAMTYDPARRSPDLGNRLLEGMTLEEIEE